MNIGKIKVLGTGCPSCKALEEAVRKAIMKWILRLKIIKVEDMAEILQLRDHDHSCLGGGRKIVLKGRVASVEEIKKSLNNKDAIWKSTIITGFFFIAFLTWEQIKMKCHLRLLCVLFQCPALCYL